MNNLASKDGNLTLFRQLIDNINVIRYNIGLNILLGLGGQPYFRREIVPTILNEDGIGEPTEVLGNI